MAFHRLLGRFVNFSVETTIHKFCGIIQVLYLKEHQPKYLAIRQHDAAFIEILLQKQIAEKMQGEIDCYKL